VVWREKFQGEKTDMAGLIVTSSRPQHTRRGNRNRGESSTFPSNRQHISDAKWKKMAVFCDVQQKLRKVGKDGMIGGTNGRWGVGIAGLENETRPNRLATKKNPFILHNLT
jgi:hypothetical protein